MKFWWFLPVMLLTGCRTSYFEISYDHLRVGKLNTQCVRDGDCYYKVEKTDGITVRWFPEYSWSTGWYLYP